MEIDNSIEKVLIHTGSSVNLMIASKITQPNIFMVEVDNNKVKPIELKGLNVSKVTNLGMAFVGVKIENDVIPRNVYYS